MVMSQNSKEEIKGFCCGCGGWLAAVHVGKGERKEGKEGGRKGGRKERGFVLVLYNRVEVDAAYLFGAIFFHVRTGRMTINA